MMTLKVKSGMTGNVIPIHNVDRVWFEDGRTWYERDGVACRMPYEYRLLEVTNDA